MGVKIPKFGELPVLSKVWVVGFLILGILNLGFLLEDSFPWIPFLNWSLLQVWGFLGWVILVKKR